MAFGVVIAEPEPSWPICRDYARMKTILAPKSIYDAKMESHLVGATVAHDVPGSILVDATVVSAIRGRMLANASIASARMLVVLARAQALDANIPSLVACIM